MAQPKKEYIPQHHRKTAAKLPKSWGFPGDLVVKNPSAKIGDMGSIPSPGRSHMLRNNYARVLQLLKPPLATTVKSEKAECSNRDPEQP